MNMLTISTRLKKELIKTDDNKDHTAQSFGESTLRYVVKQL